MGELFPILSVSKIVDNSDITKKTKLNKMGDFVGNSMLRKCSNCFLWEKKELSEHMGFCDSLGAEDNLRFCYPDKNEAIIRPTVPDFGLCDIHEFNEEHVDNLKRRLRDDPQSFEPKKKSIYNILNKKR